MKPWLMIDTEGTGLGYQIDPPHTYVDDALLEIAAILVDPVTLDEIDRFGPFAMRATEKQLSVMGAFVEDMHTRTGLLEKVRCASTPAVDEVTILLEEWMDSHGLTENVTLAGSSIKHDYEYLRRHMPTVFTRLHYRLVDVSALEVMLMAWRPELVQQVKGSRLEPPHQAMADILGSRDTLRAYQQALGLDRPQNADLEVSVRILDPDLPRPGYAHPSDAGIDLYSTSAVDIPAGSHRLVHTGVAVDIPPGHVGLIHPRSGLAAKHGVTVLNAPGTIDSGYHGEIGVILHNTSECDFKVKRGDRIAQMVVQEYVTVKLKQVSELGSSARGSGGFGSTGN